VLKDLIVYSFALLCSHHFVSLFHSQVSNHLDSGGDDTSRSAISGPPTSETTSVVDSGDRDDDALSVDSDDSNDDFEFVSVTDPRQDPGTNMEAVVPITLTTGVVESGDQDDDHALSADSDDSSDRQEELYTSQPPSPVSSDDPGGESPASEAIFTEMVPETGSVDESDPATVTFAGETPASEASPIKLIPETGSVEAVSKPATITFTEPNQEAHHGCSEARLITSYERTVVVKEAASKLKPTQSCILPVPKFKVRGVVQPSCIIHIFVNQPFRCFEEPFDDETRDAVPREASSTEVVVPETGSVNESDPG
jgi:hypothetical protein